MTNPFTVRPVDPKAKPEVYKRPNLAPRVFHNFTQAGDAKPKEAK